MSIYFVILHYLVIKETMACVESILKTQKGSNFRIVIVDNGSTNNSGAELQEMFTDEELVHVIINEENLGFAKGNNIGFQYAKKHQADFIYMINNDTLIKQKNCLDIIAKAYSQTNFHILGPDIIISKSGRHQNPARVTIQDPTYLKKMLKDHKLKLVLSYLHLDNLWTNAIKLLKNKPQVYDSDVALQTEVGVKLHGSALVFSKKYIEKYDGLYPETYMYSEEAILYYIVKRDDLKTLFYPELQIFHNEDAATEELLGKSARKRRFYYRNYIKSGNVFLQLMKKDGINV